MVTNQKASLITVLRVHRRQQSSIGTEQTLFTLCEAASRASSFSQAVIVAFDAGDTELTGALITNTHINGYDLLPVRPWGFTIPLNASVIRAHALGASRIAFISLEVTIDAVQIDQMSSLFNAGTLVVGQAMHQHNFRNDGFHDLTGLTSPWNTCAIWDLTKLAKTGFLTLSDTNTGPGQSAIEEVPTIALHQQLFPENSEALLVKLSIREVWDTAWDDTERVKWQRSKLASKDSSAISHLDALGMLPPKDGLQAHTLAPVVRHVDLSSVHMRNVEQ